MRKYLAIVMLATILLGTLAVSTSSIVIAQHVISPPNHDVYWVIPPNKTVTGLTFDKLYESETYYLASLATTKEELYDQTPLKPVVFVVEANASSQDAITGVEVIIPQDSNSKALFNLKEGQVTEDENGTTRALDWQTQVVEVDSNGWVRVFRFELSSSQTDDQTYGIRVGGYPKLYFRLYFSSGELECNYMFTVWTHDRGTFAAKEAHRSYLWLAMDKTLPVITTVPSNGDTVNGNIVPCGQHYFNISVTANDMVPSSTGVLHDTGISKVNITIDGLPFYYNSSTNIGPGQTWILPSASNSVWNLAAGLHTLTVTVWDGVGNSNSTTVQFTYVPPPVPDIRVTPISGHAAPNTWFNSTSGLWLSEQVNYASTHGTKTLGSTTTVEGWNFQEGVAVTINVTAPTYPAMYLTVAKTTTDTNGDGNGTFTATFIFPKAPAGIYVIWVYSTPCNKSATFEVVPEVIYKPDLVVGPAPINVTATGFTAANNTRPSWFFIVPDALQGVNSQINMWWFIDGNGTLQNWLNTYTVGVENVSTTLNWPWMEPGTYTVEIKHIDGDWWNGTGMNWVYKQCFVGNNTITVKETLSLLIDIKADTAYIRTSTDTITATLNQLSPVITSINGTVVTLSTTVGTVQATLNQLSPVITSINNNVVTLNTTVGQINTTMATIGPQLAAIGPDIATIKTSVGTGLNGTVTSIQGDVATITTDVGNIDGQLPTLTNYTLIAVIFSVIAAIAAIACAFLVFRKIA